MSQPIEMKSLAADRSLLKYPEVFGTLDRGCSLSKVLYVKSIPEQPDKVSLEMAVFSNTEFDQVLDWLVARATEEGAFKVVGKKLRATGVGGEKFKSDIEAKLCMEVEFVDEIISQHNGAHFLLNNFEDAVFCHQDGSEAVATKSLTDVPPWVAAIMSRNNQLFAKNDGQRLPVIFGFCGSATVFNKLNENGTTDVLGVNWFAGKSFLGLAQLLLGTNNYDEIMELAARGDRCHVDTQAKEMMQQDANSEYRLLPGDFPMFPFGKASEGVIPEGKFSREDLAAAVVGSVISGMLPQVVAYCRLHGVRRAYLGGHFFRAKVARDILRHYGETTPSCRPLRFHFMSNGHTGCLGALQVSPADVEQLRAKMNFGVGK